MIEAQRPFNTAKIPYPQGDWTSCMEWLSSRPKENPLDVEIGCGVGLHPIRYCQENPGRHLVAIEKTTGKYERFIGRVNKHSGLANLLPIQADATNWIRHFIGEKEVHRYFILYPNPYPKNRQSNQRWANMPFMSYLIHTLIPGGKITLATNIHSYFLESIKSFQVDWNLEVINASSLPKTFKARSHFEKKYLAEDQNCYELVVEKPLNYRRLDC